MHRVEAIEISSYVWIRDSLRTYKPPRSTFYICSSLIQYISYGHSSLLVTKILNVWAFVMTILFSFYSVLQFGARAEDHKSFGRWYQRSSRGPVDMNAPLIFWGFFISCPWLILSGVTLLIMDRWIQEIVICDWATSAYLERDSYLLRLLLFYKWSYRFSLRHLLCTL